MARSLSSDEELGGSPQELKSKWHLEGTERVKGCCCVARLELRPGGVQGRAGYAWLGAKERWGEGAAGRLCLIKGQRDSVRPWPAGVVGEVRVGNVVRFGFGEGPWLSGEMTSWKRTRRGVEGAPDPEGKGTRAAGSRGTPWRGVLGK